MSKPERPKLRLSPPTPDGPPTPTAIDIEIADNQGSTMAIETTPEKLQASKKMPTPSLSQMIEQLTRENGYLRQELAYQYRMRDASMYLLEETRFVVERLRMAVITFRKVQKEIEDEFAIG